MHILLCHERFLERFGVDRLLLRLAREFRDHGHRVTLVGFKFEPDIDAISSADVIRVPETEPYTALDLHASSWLAANWKKKFGEQSPDVAISAGWPFFSSLGVFADNGCRTIFCECGITPSDGLAEGIAKTLHLLDGLKTAFVPLADAIAPISDFLLESQVRSIARADQIVRTIRLSGSHVLDLTEATDNPPAIEAVTPSIIALGRFERGNYKQSEWSAPFAARLVALHPGVTVGVLATDDELSDLPAFERAALVPLGHPNDRELQRLIRAAKATVVFSRWEGFNLPLAEAAALGVHCLVLNVGAHPEVVPHPWYLCADLPELISKASALLGETGPAEILSREILTGYANRRTWAQVGEDYIGLIQEITQRPSVRSGPRQLVVQRNNLWLIDVTNAAHDPANSGVVRVCRRLANELQKLVPTLFVIWDPALVTFRFPYAEESVQLSAFGGPSVSSDHPASLPGNPFLLSHYFTVQEKIRGWLIIPEIRHDPDFAMIRHQAYAWGLRPAVVFYDAIPLLRPDLVADPSYRDGHAAYMKGLASCGIVLPISHESNNHLETFWRTHDFAEARGTTCLLPGNGNSRRPTGEVSGRREILCVSTLEPRKGHGRLIEAFIAACFEVSSEWDLILVGNRYAGAPEIAEHVEAVSREHPNVRWLGIVPDEELERLYAECAFTVYASEIEGFGLPILESIWHGRPCLCHHTGVMSELASEGGCLTANLTDFVSFRTALAKLMSAKDPLCETLRKEAIARPIKTWSEYGREFLGRLIITERIQSTQPISVPQPSTSFNRFVFGECLHDNWQMNDSERIALSALLARIRPRVAIEVGTYCGGSLSLIRQFSEVVFSLDIDPTVRTRFDWMKNVSFLTGYSHELLPPLFNALEAAALQPELILIDGDHSTEGVRRDIECLLDFVPARPCIVVMHDTANARCRAGQMAARWARSPYVHYVDLDFVPGRLVEHGGGASGEIWGGLGVALLLPSTRERSLTIGTSAGAMIGHLQAMAART